MLRTFAVWNQNKFVVIPLVVLALGQWGIAFFTLTTVKAHYDVTAGACVVAGVRDVDLDMIYLYSKCSLMCQNDRLLRRETISHVPRRGGLDYDDSWSGKCNTLLKGKVSV